MWGDEWRYFVRWADLLLAMGAVTVGALLALWVVWAWAHSRP